MTLHRCTVKYYYAKSMFFKRLVAHTTKMAESRVVKKRLTDTYRCGYCLQFFNKVGDFRTLPCLHVYCMQCLKTDIGARKDHITCAYCR